MQSLYIQNYVKSLAYRIFIINKRSNMKKVTMLVFTNDGVGVGVVSGVVRALMTW